MAAVLGPLLILGGLELGLRLAGCGYPTSFFVPFRTKNQVFYVPNSKFTCRFFSATKARPSLPIRVAAQKSTNEYRIFLFGESAALGDPDASYGIGRYLQVLLRERFPQTDFKVLCVAVTGISSHTILPIARECAQHQGDAWVIYMGNNEMVGPFGAETVFGARAPSLAMARASLALKQTRTEQVLAALASRFRSAAPAPDSWGGMQIGMQSSPALPPAGKAWGGMQMFTENRLRHDDPARLRVYDNFKGNLDDILLAGRRAGVPVVLSTVAVNLKESPPFASLHRAGLDQNQEDRWNQIYQEGVALENEGSYREALAHYREAAKVDAEYADLQFHMGTCDLALTNEAQARQEFALARDYDALAFRTDSILNQAIKAAAARHATQGVYLVDGEQVLAQQSPAGLPGLNLFYEHVHLNFEGNYLLALQYAEQIRSLLPASIRAHDKGSWASAELSGRRLAATVWDRQRVWQPIFNRLAAPPFTGQMNHEAFLRLSQAKLEETKAQLALQSPAQARQLYEEALALAPEDNLLHANFEQFLEAGGNLADAVSEAMRVSELTPHLPEPYCHTGVLLVRLGRIQEAKESFLQAISLKRDYAQAYSELGLIFFGEGQLDQAAANFKRALKADPDFGEACYNLAFLEQHDGRTAQAMQDYDKAATLQPQGPGDFLDRAVRFSAMHRSAEALNCCLALVQQMPSLWQAHYLLGQELAAAGRTDEAQREFSEVLRYRPDYAQLLPSPFSAGNATSH